MSEPSYGRRTTMRIRPHLIPTIVVAVMLLVALAPLSYGYYQFLRWAVCGVAVFIAVKSYTWKQTWATCLFGATAAMFNPILPIDLTRETWQPIDLVSAFLFISSILLLPEPAAVLMRIKQIWHELELWRKVMVTILILMLVGGGAFIAVSQISTATELTADQVKTIMQRRFTDAVVVSVDYKGQGIWQGKIWQTSRWFYVIFDEKKGSLFISTASPPEKGILSGVGLRK